MRSRETTVSGVHGDQRSVAGSLLVSAAHLIDPNFRRTVVLVIEHSPDGALGVVLNEPLDLDARGILPDWDDLLADPPFVFRGGPVQPEVALGIGRTADGPPVVVDLEEDVADIDAVRFFSGYSGWAPHQLDAELADNDWLVVPADPGDPFTDDPEALWRRVVARLDGDDVLLATLPMDPRLN
ncbi:MAG: YqgE/AlgH family protein [Acidimicrobiia bacterium]|nr:YqgE/AlgH family protein [Acidimicrobiia bacterium]